MQLLMIWEEVHCQLVQGKQQVQIALILLIWPSIVSHCSPNILFRKSQFQASAGLYTRWAIGKYNIHPGRGNFVNVFQNQTYNVGSSLSMADTQFQTILTSLQGEATSLMFWIRPSSQGGSNHYGLGLLEENLELSQVNYITDDSYLPESPREIL